MGPFQNSIPCGYCEDYVLHLPFVFIKNLFKKEKKKTLVKNKFNQRSGKMQEENNQGNMHACSVMSDSLRPHGLQPTRLLYLWASPGKNTRVGCHALLQGIFPSQGSNPRFLQLLNCMQILCY